MGSFWKKNLAAWAIAGILIGTTETAAAEEADLYTMEPKTVYDIDLDGDGETEKIRFETGTMETFDWGGEAPESSEEENAEPWIYSEEAAVLMVYMDDRLILELTGQPYTYSFSVSQCPTEEGGTYLLAYSRGDNDWNPEAYFLALGEEGMLNIVGDVTELSREKEEGEGPLSGWARLGSVYDVGKNSVTLRWLDINDASGILEVLVKYEFTEDGLKAEDPPYNLLNKEKDWTAVTDFAVVKEPSGEEAFQVSEGDVVKLVAMSREAGATYLKCVNEEGEAGWMKYEDGAELWKDGIYGYFAEAFFAG